MLIYLLIYAAMNLGAFAVVIAVARRTALGRDRLVTPGWARRSPALAVMMTIFLFSLAGIPPFAGWFAKFVMFRAVLDADTPSAVVLGVHRRGRLGGRVLLLRRGRPQDVVPRRRAEPARPRPTAGARRRSPSRIGLTAVVVVVVGVYPQFFARIGELAFHAA